MKNEIRRVPSNGDIVERSTLALIGIPAALFVAWQWTLLANPQLTAIRTTPEPTTVFSDTVEPATDTQVYQPATITTIKGADHANTPHIKYLRHKT